jgi:hypothetical protein
MVNVIYGLLMVQGFAEHHVSPMLGNPEVLSLRYRLRYLIVV